MVMIPGGWTFFFFNKWTSIIWDAIHSFSSPFYIIFSWSANTFHNIFLSVHHACSSQKPCHGGVVCQAVGWIYQCNCTNTNHYGPNCKTGRKFLNVHSERVHIMHQFLTENMSCWLVDGLSCPMQCCDYCNFKLSVKIIRLSNFPCYR